MTSGIKTIIYPVEDLGRAKALFGRFLGVDPYMDEPYYVGFRVGDQDIGLDPNGHARGLTGPVAYWHVADIHESFKLLVDTGAAEKTAIEDVGGGKLVATLADPDGNTIGLIQTPDSAR